MPRGSQSIEIAASCETVFDLVHDYDRRLDWDSMLSRAELVGGATAADVGVRSLCVGTWKGAFLALETRYVSFERGRVAAVELTNRPLFFDHFAASIKHEALGEARSKTTYVYFFRARPGFLAPLLEPIIKLLLAREVRARLVCLRDFLESPRGAGAHAA